MVDVFYAHYDLDGIISEISVRKSFSCISIPPELAEKLIYGHERVNDYRVHDVDETATLIDIRNGSVYPYNISLLNDDTSELEEKTDTVLSILYSRTNGVISFRTNLPSYYKPVFNFDEITLYVSDRDNPDSWFTSLVITKQDIIDNRAIHIENAKKRKISISAPKFNRTIGIQYRDNLVSGVLRKVSRYNNETFILVKESSAIEEPGLVVQIGKGKINFHLHQEGGMLLEDYMAREVMPWLVVDNENHDKILASGFVSLKEIKTKTVSFPLKTKTKKFQILIPRAFNYQIRIG